MIDVRNAARAGGIDVRALKAAARELLAAADEHGSSLSVSLVRDGEISRLNRDHRGKSNATDVLSFPLNPWEHAPAPERLLGDIVISVDTARRQAAEYDAPLQNEIYRLLIHGILHLLGHDHQEPGQRARMESEERRLAAAIGMPWPY